MKEGRKMPYNCRGPNKEQKIIRFDPAYRRSAPTKYRPLSSYRERGYERQGSRDLRKRRRAIDKIPCTTVTCGVTALEPPLSFITIMNDGSCERSLAQHVCVDDLRVGTDLRVDEVNCVARGAAWSGRQISFIFFYTVALNLSLLIPLPGSGSGSDPLPSTLELRKDIRLLPMINLLGRYIFGLVTQMRRQLEAIYNNGSHRDRSSLIPRENGRAVFTLILFPLRMRITLTSRRRVLFAKHGTSSDSIFDKKTQTLRVFNYAVDPEELPSRAPVYTLNRAVYPPARPWLAHQLLPAGFRIPSAETSQSFGGKIEPGKSKLERFPTEVLSEILAATAQKYPDSHLDILESVVTRGNILLLSKRMAEADIYSNGSSLTIAGSNANTCCEVTHKPLRVDPTRIERFRCCFPITLPPTPLDKPLNPPLITHLDIDFQSSPIWANILRMCHDIEILRLNSDRGNHLRTEVYREMRDRVLAGYIRGGPTNITEVTFSSPPPSNAGGLTARRAFASLAKRGSQVKGDCVRFHQHVFRVRVLGCQGYFPPHIDTNAMELFKRSNRIGDSLVAAQVYETINGSQLIRASYSIVLAFTDENETERVFNSGIWQGGVRRRAEKFFPRWDDGIGGYV
ncbi:hypothetical protein C8F04DRAFT_1190914 [Mycena alexandri]|uniref:Uncharacterized protein n=1 Tax=Mycena alexandri TaxID=1745969 RepID=A0AAD6SDK7_9AGAR|nr:hypothetical protein C8F04DRAFT_1190914 [Mycena alexandri]